MTVVPVYNIVLVPNADIVMTNDLYKNMTGKNAKVGERVILIALKELKTRDQFSEDSFYPIGVTGEVVRNNTERDLLFIRTGERRNIEEIRINYDHSIELSVSRREDIEDLDPELENEQLGRLKNAILDASIGQRWEAGIRDFLGQFHTMDEAIAIVGSWMSETTEERYELLTIDSKKERMEKEFELAFQTVERTRLSNEAQNAQEQENQRFYREQALRKQIEYLQKELDDMNPDSVSDLRRMERSIDAAGMLPEAEKEARKVLNRLKQEGQHSQESGMLHDYLDFMTSLSWKKEEVSPIDLDQARRILDEDHYGLKKVKERIIQQIAVMNLKKEQSGSILLFVGAPGTGKTSIGKSIAKALGRKYVRVALGGVRDEADIRGHRRTYLGAMPGRIMDGINKSGVSNPVMVLDEIDKLGQSYNGDPASALLEVLDPEQNHTFTDHYMNVPYDLSDVFFICTANSLDSIPAPLLNRMELIQFQGYTPIEKFAIAKEHLIGKSLSKVGMTEDQVQIADETIRSIIDDYTREAGVRGLKKHFDSICRVAAVAHVDDPTKQIRVTKEDLPDYLDMNPMRQKEVGDRARPGVITGLAWTPVGGTILYIETLLTKGKGRVQVTGRLGDVMKESAQIAVSLVKSLYPEKAKVFEENDLHIHVPDGATPKDGPSAGITLVSAISSLILEQSVSPRFAMTGEVSLQGQVNPIGGLPEKLMAAQRAGVETVFIPKENERDLRDVAEEVKQELSILPVERVEEVLGALGLPLPGSLPEEEENLEQE